MLASNLRHWKKINKSIKLHYLHDLGSINMVSGSLSYNLSRVSNILEHCFMDRSKSSVAWSLNSGAFLRGTHDSSGGDKDNIFATELFLKLSDKTRMNLAESFPQSKWNVDHNSLTVA